MHSISSSSRARFLRRTLLFLAAACAVTACASEQNSNSQPTLAYRHAPRPHPQRKSRVLVRDYVPALSSARTDATPATLRAGQALCLQLTAALGATNELVIVDPVDVESAPPEFRERLADYAISVELSSDSKSGSQLELALALTALRDGTLVERFKHDFEPGVTAPVIDDLTLRAMVHDIGVAIARRPWSTTVLDKAERTLIIGGGRATGIGLGDRLCVRRHLAHYDQGIDKWIQLAGQQVAQIVVESYVGDGHTERGAQCRLVAGTIGGFENSELWVEDVSPDNQ